MISVSNQEFLKAIFGGDFIWAHVTSHCFDPSDVPEEMMGRCWAGKHYIDSDLIQTGNQYFCISLFNNQGSALRRKELFHRAYCIVVDDVGEKVSVNKMLDGPAPSWIMETSAGSMQWGYILEGGCKDSWAVESLLSGLIERFGKDPGMAGVTRYVRLPEGYNWKKSKLVDGKPFKCKLILWEPGNVYEIYRLAEAMDVRLVNNVDRSIMTRLVSLWDHPIFSCEGVLQVRGERSAGVYEVRCPWVERHGGGADNGAAVFIRDDGSVGFKCHHGSCQGKGGRDLIAWLIAEKFEFRRMYYDYLERLRDYRLVKYGVKSGKIAIPNPNKFLNVCVDLPF